MCMKKDLFPFKIAWFNEFLNQEEKWFQLFFDKLWLEEWDWTKTLYLDKNLFQEMGKVYKKANWYKLVFEELVWEKNNFWNPIKFIW